MSNGQTGIPSTLGVVSTMSILSSLWVLPGENQQKQYAQRRPVLCNSSSKAYILICACSTFLSRHSMGLTLKQMIATTTLPYQAWLPTLNSTTVHKTVDQNGHIPSFCFSQLKVTHLNTGANGMPSLTKKKKKERERERETLFIIIFFGVK